MRNLKVEINHEGTNMSESIIINGKNMDITLLGGVEGKINEVIINLRAEMEKRGGRMTPFEMAKFLVTQTEVEINDEDFPYSCIGLGISTMLEPGKETFIGRALLGLPDTWKDIQGAMVESTKESVASGDLLKEEEELYIAVGILYHIGQMLEWKRMFTKEPETFGPSLLLFQLMALGIGH